MSETAVAELADALWRAEQDREPIPPITDTRPAVGLADAYAIQSHNIARRVAGGRVVRGRKVAFTSRAIQDLLGADGPGSGVLLDDMFTDDGAEIAASRLCQPRVVAQLAFVMAADLAGPGVTTTDALTAIGGVLPVIEVSDSRIAGWRVRQADAIADNVSAARVVTGGTLIRVPDVDLRLLGTLLYRNGVPVESGAGAAALGHPARGVAWLANAAAADGPGLRRGDIVLSGALHRMVPVRPGDVFRAAFAHLGSVTARFSEEAVAP
jgi:2-keto-4-pentenoate hydratase